MDFEFWLSEFWHATEIFRNTPHMLPKGILLLTHLNLESAKTMGLWHYNQRQSVHCVKIALILQSFFSVNKTALCKGLLTPLIGQKNPKSAAERGTAGKHGLPKFDHLSQNILFEIEINDQIELRKPKKIKKNRFFKHNDSMGEGVTSMFSPCVSDSPGRRWWWGGLWFTSTLHTPRTLSHRPTQRQPHTPILTVPPTSGGNVHHLGPDPRRPR